MIAHICTGPTGAWVPIVDGYSCEWCGDSAPALALEGAGTCADCLYEWQRRHNCRFAHDRRVQANPMMPRRRQKHIGGS